MDNLRLADKTARLGKSTQPGVIAHVKNQESNLFLLHEMLLNRRYKTSEYTRFIIHEPKEREIFRLPYFPDRITHHAVMNVVRPIFVQHFTADTYSCIKGRGIHGAARAVRKALEHDFTGTQYCLKLDVQKFYPSIDHSILKSLLRRKFKDPDLLWLMDEIIDSADGLPIGNYLSQYFANFYLSGLDHYIKEQLQVKHYFRYADDLVFLSGSKEFLHGIFHKVKNYLQEKLHLKVKSNYQIFPVAARGIDYVGYRFFHRYVLLRKSIKQNFARMVARRKNDASVASYMGWLKHCNSVNLINKLLCHKPKLHSDLQTST